MDYKKLIALKWVVLFLFPPLINIAQNDLDNGVYFGYQGWFNAEGDGSPTNDWRHWFRADVSPSVGNLTIDFWPDMSELNADELYPTPFTYRDGSTASLYSNYNEKTVLRHFKWMQDYELKGVFLQRFVTEIQSPPFLEIRNTVLDHVIKGAQQYGRKFAIMYDIAGVARNDIFREITDDWMALVDNKNVVQQDGYIHQDNLPVVSIWGWGVNTTASTPEILQQVTDWFHNPPDPKYKAYVMGGVDIEWQNRPDASEWRDAFLSLDMISPWAVGTIGDNEGSDFARENWVEPDLATTSANGVDYMPVVFPGFSWKNLTGGAINEIRRNGGRFFWRQVFNAIDAGANHLYVAMFDEVDEGTAMYKVIDRKEDLPVEPELAFLDMDGFDLDSDFYLRLASEAQKVLEGSKALSPALPLNSQRNERLVVYYPFDQEDLTRIIDQSGLNNDGDVIENISYTDDGRYHRAIEFRGDGSLVNIGGYVHTREGITLSTWVKHTDLTSNLERYITVTPEIAVLRHSGNRTLQAFITAGGNIEGVSSDNALTEGEFQHVAMTYNGSILKLFLNGNIVASKSINKPMDIDRISNVEISSGGESLNGALDDLRIYNYALSDQQVDSLFMADVTSSITETSPEVFLSVFPNPASDVLHIKTHNPGTIQIFNASGKLWNQLIQPHQTIKVDLNQFPTGIMVVIFENKDGKRTGKMIIKQ